jgi:hypothetical protein
MTEREFSESLTEAIYSNEDLFGEIEDDIFNVRSFLEAGVLTTDKGLVVKVGSNVFHLTIQKVK